MNRKEIINVMKNWYTRPDVKFEIIKLTKNKEFSVLVPSWLDKEERIKNTRMLKVHSVQHLDFMFKALHVFEREKIYNLYYTIATYKNGIPNQTYNFAKRDNRMWNKQHYNEMSSFDFFIDVDCDEFENMDYCHESAKMIKQCLDHFNVPYEIRFSGKGFHFIIPYEYLPKQSLNPSDEINLFRTLALTTEKLHDTLSEMVDTTVYDSRRLCKIPYTLAIYEDKIMVCTPILSDEEFNNFHLDNYSVEKFDNDISGRGTKIFNKDGHTKSFFNYLRVAIMEGFDNFLIDNFVGNPRGLEK